MPPPLILTNHTFKNAVVNQQVTSNVSWPLLDSTNNKPKANKKCSRSRVNEDVLTEKNVIPSSSCLNEENHSSNCDHEDFPELCRTFLKGKVPFPPRKRSSVTSATNDSKPSCPKTVSKSSYKNPKLKNSILNIPLLSFVKQVHRVKKRQHNKPAPQHKCLPSGNKLDSDNPSRKKGKVRLLKKKYESRLKKEILQSKIIKKKQVYNLHFLKVKCLVPSLINNDSKLNIDKLEPILSSLSIDENTCDSVKSVSFKETSGNQNNLHGEEFELRELSKNILHSNAFKGYCNNIVNVPLLKSAESLVTTLRNYQDKFHAKDPSKAFAKRRYLCGFKETKKFLLADRVKLIIIATNLQLETDLPSGRVLEEIKSICEEKNIPLVFAGRGNQIGYWTLKRRRISIVSILNYEGAEALFCQLIKNWEECKKSYETVLSQIELHLSKSTNENEDQAKCVEEEIREQILSKLLEVNSQEGSNNLCLYSSDACD